VLIGNPRWLPSLEKVLVKDPMENKNKRKIGKGKKIKNLIETNLHNNHWMHGLVQNL
jgi:hypothetical protein